MFAGESDFGCLWVVLGAGRGFPLVVGVLSHCVCEGEWFWVFLGGCGSW